jgi:hypothetical protein
VNSSRAPQRATTKKTRDLGARQLKKTRYLLGARPNDPFGQGYNPLCPVLLLYVGLYFVGMLLGLAAKIALDVQLRRPGTRQVVGLFVLVLLLWGATSVTHTPFTEIVLPLVWAGTGLLAGLGSREMHTAT